MNSSKRKAPPSQEKQPTKRAKVEVPEYHLTPSIKNEDGSIQWPAPQAQIGRAREIILQSAKSDGNVLIVPDKDADGLSAGAILRHTLILLGLSKERIHVHLLSKGTNIHSEDERQKMASCSPAFVFVVDQGSRSGPSIIDSPHTGLIVDHHHATEQDFPTESEHVTACLSPPVATSALLTYHLCEPLHPDVASTTDWLCVVGTHGDLGNTLKWEPPFPDMKPTMKKYSKKTLNDVVSLINAPRRTATFDVRSAWDALCETAEPASVLKNPRLLAARAEVNAEVERVTHTAPKFSPDGKIAVFRIKSQAQVHPVIATRWAGHLQSKALEIVLVANEDYTEGKVHFSCRIPRCARSRDPPVNIIESLKAYARLPEVGIADDEGGTEGVKLEHDGTADLGAAPKIPLLERLGDNFARGHVQASGGIVEKEDFEDLMRRMQIGVKVAKTTGEKDASSAKGKGKAIDGGQKNTLLGYFGKKAAAKS
ncbi:uncharacterized protein MYCGRDRAFT_109168 [Zymoseptoria tritici IPO323]|uniref:DDH domain-containing protein n=1 Tax=Zymoseptoria tritici (strain CBS 115943 / IPO323) TaxID=336722 RepID=F9X927_ZYMTI|nr:uncharacterized protein MYCGRDRAFT_109168 [Zymoseptoria tritici IPO323]EGP88344.1 hypothetical protein MYCGRDRAFT_109168 [Zymoseptoria tritici IPO323]